jgi:hypothetical protein
MNFRTILNFINVERKEYIPILNCLKPIGIEFYHDYVAVSPFFDKHDMFEIDLQDLKATINKKKPAYAVGLNDMIDENED